ncbi:MAG: sodium/proton-translocating pyrophosphatase [Saprospiraceae bacterium]|nr:sodium/proton-translocating pyrophosphatase [Saprospiraceae bacterium]
MENLVYLPVLMALGGLAYMAYLWGWVSKQDAGTGKMQEISTAIAEGALSFLNAEYRVLSYFCRSCGGSFSGSNHFYRIRQFKYVDFRSVYYRGGFLGYCG